MKHITLGLWVYWWVIFYQQEISVSWTTKQYDESLLVYFNYHLLHTCRIDGFVCRLPTLSGEIRSLSVLPDDHFHHHSDVPR
jgi:hypothetical protein